MTGMSPDIFQVKTGTRPQCFHGADGQLWCYNHQLNAIKIEPINKTFMKRELRIKKKSLSSYLGRGLHSDKWDNVFGKDGKLGGLIEMVKKDDELEGICLRFHPRTVSNSTIIITNVKSILIRKSKETRE